MPQDEIFSWRKFLSGPFVGKNYAKAIVTLICGAIILFLAWGAFSLVNGWLQRGKLSQRSETRVGPNSGTITQTDDHTQVVHNHAPFEDGLLGLLFGSKNKTEKVKDSP